MYRRRYPMGAGGHGRSSDPPQSVRNRTVRCSSDPGRRLLRFYGPPRSSKRYQEDLAYFKRRYPSLFPEVEKAEKEKEKEEEESRITEKEAEELPTLTVKKVGFMMHPQPGGRRFGNAKKHRTDKYENNKTGGTPVLRRGQEFKLRIQFDRPYNREQDDLTFVMEADEDPGKELLVDFKLDEERKKPFDPLPHWAARLKKENPKNNVIKAFIYIPADCMVGEWDLKIKTWLRGEEQSYVYVHPTPFIVLFNPWCKEDQVYYPGDPKDLEEYVLNDKGTAYVGSANWPQSRPWNYGQFKKDVLPISVSLLRQAFDFKITTAMRDPVLVSRALSRIVNSSGDNGVLTGNWSGDYCGGTPPTKWECSDQILCQFREKSEPVKFGQCWVFSHVLTAVCRALGLPCRSVTNFDSAHDVDASCTIDVYYDAEGNEIKHMKKDSIWNFHVWNEVWMNRPDITEHDVNGWHIIDATPQEQSEGVFQCGPSPVKAVKNGLIYVPYDTAFVFSEVNADIVHWYRDEHDQFKPSAYKKKSVGSRISTKPCDGKPFAGKINFRQRDNPDLRCDLTDQYKYPEDSAEERVAVKRAVWKTRRGGLLYQNNTDVEVEFDKECQAMVGDEVKVSCTVKNCSDKDKDMDMLMKARTSSYWNDANMNKEVHSQNFGVKKVKAGAVETLQMTVTADMYMDKVDEDVTLYFYVRAKDIERNMPHSAQQPYALGKPGLAIKGKEKAKSKEKIPIKVAITNTTSKTWTGCSMTTDGDLYFCEDDPNVWDTFLYFHTVTIPDIAPKEMKTVDLLMYWEDPPVPEDEDSDDEDDDDEDEAAGGSEATKEEFYTQGFSFEAREMPCYIDGEFQVQLIKP